MDHRHNPKLTPSAKALRKGMTREERHLWYDFLRDYPVRFLRQKVIDEFVVDFYCAQAGLVVELDGSQHDEPEARQHDAVRTERLARRGLLVVRIPNNEVFGNFEGVCAYLDTCVQESLHRQGRSPSLSHGICE